MKEKAPVSLLWPPEMSLTHRDAGKMLNEHSIRDLDVAKILAVLGPETGGIEDVVLRLCPEPHVIRYRQSILEDLLYNPEVGAGFEKLIPVLIELAYSCYRDDKQMPVFHKVVWRVNELSRLVEGIVGIQTLLSKHRKLLHSAGLRNLLVYVSAIRDEAIFQQLEQELPDLLDNVNQARSVTIGVNLDHNLLPVEAMLLSVNKTPITEASLMEKLLGRLTGRRQGIAQLHVAPQDTGTGIAVSPLLTPLFHDLSDVLNKVCQPLAQSLKQYTSLQSGVLTGIGKEVKFYTRAVGFIRQMQEAGLPMCKPEILPAEDRVYEVDENYNVNLALHLLAEHSETSLADRIVVNHVNFNGQGRILLLTGPNKGGKTTYMQSVGLTHILAQAGLYVPGTHARISPVDALYTHFPEEEQFDAGTGRFGDEAQRMQAIFSNITRHSLVLLNESFSSTSPAEALELSRDIALLLRQLGTRAIFTTHLHELAAEADALNSDVFGDSCILSMVASRMSDETTKLDENLRRSYNVIPSPPMQNSRARELARQYGVSFDQLHALLRQRGVMLETPAE